MSQQRIDSIARKLISASKQYDKKNYKKALQILEEAEIASKQAKVPSLIAKTLVLKGNVLEADFSIEEALKAYDQSFGISSHLYLEDPDNYDHLMILEGSVTGIKDTIDDLDDLVRAETIYQKNEDVFLELLDVMMEHEIDAKEEEAVYHLSYVEAMNNILIFFGMAGESQIKASHVLKVIEKYIMISEMDKSFSELGTLAQSMTQLYGEFFVSNEAFEDAKKVYYQYHELIDKKYKKNPQEATNFIPWVNAKFFLGDIYTTLEQTDDAYSHLSEALEHLYSRCENEPEKGRANICNGFIAKTYQKMGKLFVTMGDIEQATSFFERSFEIYEQMQDFSLEYIIMESEDYSPLEDMAEFFENVGDVDKAERTYMLEIDIFEHLIADGIEELKYRSFIAQTYDQLAILFADNDNLEKAENYFLKEIAMYKDLRMEDPEDLDNDRSIVKAFAALGRIYFESDFELSLDYYEKALGTCETIRGIDGDIACDMGHYLNKIAVLCAANGQYEMALDKLKEALEILGNDFNENRSFNFLREFADVYITMSNVYESLDDNTNEQECFLKGVDSYRSILQHDDILIEIKITLTMEIMIKESYYMELEEYEKAKKLVELCCTFYEDTFEYTSTYPDIIMFMAVLYNDLAKIHHRSGSFDRSIENYLRSISILEEAMADYPDDAKYLNVIGITSTELGMVYKDSDELELAKQCFERTGEIQDQIARIEPSYTDVPKGAWELSFLEGYADVLDRLGMIEEANAYKAKADEKRRELKCDWDDDTIAFE